MTTANRNGSTRRWRKLRLLILARDQRRCHWCGAYANDVDHLTPQAQGGLDTPSNLVAACARCNRGRGGQLGRQRQNARYRTPPRPGPRHVWPGAITPEV